MPCRDVPLLHRFAYPDALPNLVMPRQHYMYFVYEFNLIPKREELQPLQELIDKLLERDTGGAARGVLCAASTCPAACSDAINAGLPPT